MLFMLSSPAYLIIGYLLMWLVVVGALNVAVAVIVVVFQNKVNINLISWCNLPQLLSHTHINERKEPGQVNRFFFQLVLWSTTNSGYTNYFVCILRFLHLKLRLILNMPRRLFILCVFVYTPLLCFWSSPGKWTSRWWKKVFVYYFHHKLNCRAGKELNFEKKLFSEL